MNFSFLMLLESAGDFLSPWTPQTSSTHFRGAQALSAA